MFENNKIAGTVLFVSWLAKYQLKKLLNTAILTVDKLGKAVSHLAHLAQGKLHIFKKVDLSTFKEIL